MNAVTSSTSQKTTGFTSKSFTTIMVGLVIILVTFFTWSNTNRESSPQMSDKQKLSHSSSSSSSFSSKVVANKNIGSDVLGNDHISQYGGGVESLQKFIQPVDEKHLQSLFTTYQPEILYSGLGNIFRIKDKIYKLQITSKDGKEFKMVEVDSCDMTTLLDVFEMSQNPIIHTESVFSNHIQPGNFTLSVESVSIDRSFMETESQILIVYTTCNQLPMTILSLQFLRNTDKLADLVVIDDHSTDGTVEYLRKRGFAVITKPKATGLTDSWNIGYRLAVALGYKHVVFTNNDVLLTTGSVALMYQGLRDYGLVVPLTTEKGAGHHPAQSIMRAYKLPAAMASYTDDYRNAEFIQESILKKYIFVPPEQRRCPAEYSKSKGLPKFNGFCFSVNVEKITPAAYEENIHLFDPTDLIVGQEDHLVQRMHAHKLMPIILHCAFVYHFKSVTVSSANFSSFVEQLKVYNVSAKQIGKSPLAKLSFGSGNDTLTKTVDIREDLRWYHPEEQADFVAEIFNWSTPNKLKEHNKGKDRSGLQCKPPSKEGLLFPLEASIVSSRLDRLYNDYSKMNWNIRTNPLCVYPSQWPPHCQQMLTGSSSFEPELYAVSSSHYIVIAIAMSDPVKTPSAGDVFTAYELGNALMNLFSHVKVRYLRRGVQWYSPEYLSDVDVLITLLDQYDLTRTLSLFQDPTPPAYPKSLEFQCIQKLQIKPNLISIAWIRNWFHRWLTKPWIGNYDAILTSSSLTKSFYDGVMGKIGFPVSCALSCPHKVPGYKLKRLAEKYLSANNSNGINKGDQPWYLFPARAETPTYVYPIATAIEQDFNSSIIRGSPPKSKSSHPPTKPGVARYNQSNSISSEARRVFRGVDYVFTGSYFNVPRRIMDFDPDSIPQWTGRIVGGNWEKVRRNLTTGWMSITLGLLPYELVKESYKYVKIVVDDSNHVTAPWGSVNSRVFDALASGAMVISNGEIGLNELFGPALRRHNLRLPLYSTGKDLATTLNYYLSNDEIREKTLRVMRDVVMHDHTYQQRALQLVDLLESKFAMKFTRRSDSHNGKHHHSHHTHSKHGHKDTDSRRLDELERKTVMDSPVADIPLLHKEVKEQNAFLEAVDDLFANSTGQTVHVVHDDNFVEELPHLELGRQLSETTPSAAAKKPSPPTKPLQAPFRRNRVAGDKMPHDIHSLCVGVRTSHGQSEWLPVLIRSLVVQHQKSSFRTKLALQLFIVDTEANTEYTQFIIDLADKFNEQYQFPYVQVMVGVQTAVDNQNSNKLYGYDDTDRLLYLMLSMKQCGRNSAVAYDQAANINGTAYRNNNAFLIPSCEWLMFTNGDNMYNSAWFDTIAPLAISQKPEKVSKLVKNEATKEVVNKTEVVMANEFDMVGWDFITHHPRGARNDTPNQPIQIAFERGFLDLGSVIVRSSLFTYTNTRFLQEAALTKDLFARDYFTVKRLLPLTKQEKIKLIHQYLLLHQ